MNTERRTAAVSSSDAAFLSRTSALARVTPTPWPGLIVLHRPRNPQPRPRAKAKERRKKWPTPRGAREQQCQQAERPGRRTRRSRGRKRWRVRNARKSSTRCAWCDDLLPLLSLTRFRLNTEKHVATSQGRPRSAEYCRALQVQALRRLLCDGTVSLCRVPSQPFSSRTALQAGVLDEHREWHRVPVSERSPTRTCEMCKLVYPSSKAVSHFHFKLARSSGLR